MPELPEVETIAGDLGTELAGREIVGASVRRPDVLRGVTAVGLSRRLHEEGVLRVWRRAKAVVIDLQNGDRLVVTPRFTGTLRMEDAGASGHDPYDAVAFELDDGRRLVYRDVRRLGTVALLSPTAFTTHDKALGIEPLDRGFTVERLSVFVRQSSVAIKRLLMDQRRIAGIGNIYANEVLWMAGIDPSRPARRVEHEAVLQLHDAVSMVLRAAVRARGTTFRDFRDAYGRRGAYSAQLRVYGRSGHPCPRCATRVALTHAVDGRATYFCFRCQA